VTLSPSTGQPLLDVALAMLGFAILTAAGLLVGRAGRLGRTSAAALPSTRR
jgi:hypothetical protein